MHKLTIAEKLLAIKEIEGWDLTDAAKESLIWGICEIPSFSILKKEGNPDA